MALINRFSRLFRADLHAVLDRIEEPVSLLKQAVREMEDDVAEDSKNLKLLQLEREQAPQRQKELDERLDELQEEITLCLDSDNEKLARTVIKRKLEVQQRSKRNMQKTQTLDKDIQNLGERLENNRSRLLAMQQKLEILLEEQASMRSQNTAYDPDVAISEDDIDVALLKEKQARAGA